MAEINHGRIPATNHASMDRNQALAILDLPPSAGETEIHRQCEQRRAELEKRVANAPTFPLKAKYRTELARLEEALEALQTAAQTDEGLHELPVIDKQFETGRSLGFGEALEQRQTKAEQPSSSPARRQPPSREGDNSPSKPASEGRRPPQRPDDVPASSAPGKRSLPAPPARSAPMAPAPVESATPEEIENDTPAVPAPPRPAWVKWTLLGAILVFLLGGAYAGWIWWYLPKVARENQATAARLLAAISGQAGSIQDTVPKVRVLAWIAAALGNAEEPAAADNLIAQARSTLSSMSPGSIRSELECHLLIAQAMKGDPTGALAQLTNMQAAREKTAKAPLIGTGRLSTTSKTAVGAPLVPIREDEARRGIAVAQAREGQWREAQGTINGIMDDRCACEALAAVAEALAQDGDKTQTTTVLQTLEGRAAKIQDPAVKAALLCTVAERMNHMGGKSDAKRKFVSEAISAASSGSTLGGGGAMASRSALGQARVLRTLWRTKDKAGFEKKIVEVAGLAGMLNGTSGTNNQKPDFAARAEVYAAIALAWSDAGNETNASSAIDAAITAAGQARLPLEPSAAEVSGLVPDLHKQRSLAAVVRALAEMRQFDKAEEVLRQLSSPDEIAAAAESLAYWLGWEGEVERGQTFTSRLPEGEVRCRSVVALQYGVRQAELERWW